MAADVAKVHAGLKGKARRAKFDDTAGGLRSLALRSYQPNPFLQRRLPASRNLSAMPKSGPLKHRELISVVVKTRSGRSQSGPFQRCPQFALARLGCRMNLDHHFLHPLE
jgi:hypothetical protein